MTSPSSPQLDPNLSLTITVDATQSIFNSASERDNAMSCYKNKERKRLRRQNMSQEEKNRLNARACQYMRNYRLKKKYQKVENSLGKKLASQSEQVLIFVNKIFLAPNWQATRQN